MTNEELVAQLEANTAQVVKIKGEVQKLLDIISSNADNVPQEVVDAANGLKDAIQQVDDQNPDA